MRVNWFWSIPVVVAFLAFGDGIVGVLLQGGSFGRGDTRIVYAALAILTLGLLPANGSRVLVTSLYAVGNTKTPARIGMIRVIVSAAIGAGLMFFMKYKFDSVIAVLGLCMGSAIGSWIEFAMLQGAVARTLEGSLVQNLSLGRIAMVCVSAAAVIRTLTFVVPGEWREPAIFIAPFLFGAAVVVFGFVMKLPELMRLLNALTKRRK